MDLTFLSEDDGLDAVTGDMIAAYLDLAEQMVTEPQAEQGIVEILVGGGESVAVEA